MNIIIHEFLTLDGVMQGPGGAEEDPVGGFEHGGWLVPYFDADAGAIVDSWFQRTEAVLLGRTTYELMAPYWSTVTDPDNRAGVVLNTYPKYVVSSTLGHADWGDTAVLGSIEAVAQLKQRAGGELQVHGSAGLAVALQEAGLVDGYRLLTFPVTVGKGKRLFSAEAPPAGYEVTHSQTTSTGAVYVELGVTEYAGQGAFAVVDGVESH